MNAAQKIVIDDAKKILKNIGSADANILEAYIEIETQRQIWGRRTFDNILAGIGVVSLIAIVAAVLWVGAIGFYRSETVASYGRNMSNLENRLIQIEQTTKELEEQDVLIQKVKTFCSDFEE